jgi:hypothetical protein
MKILMRILRMMKPLIILMMISKSKAIKISNLTKIEIFIATIQPKRKSQKVRKKKTTKCLRKKKASNKNLSKNNKSPI